MKILILSSVVLSILLFSCKKETPLDDTCGTITAEVFENYIPLQDSNYWEYERCDVDTLGNKSCYSIYDTVFVVGDEVINGITYKKLKRGRIIGTIIPEFLRGSNGELFTPEYEDNSGILTGDELIIFSESKDSLQKLRCRTYTWSQNCNWKYSLYMLNTQTTVSVPAGNLPVTSVREYNLRAYSIPYYGYLRNRDFHYTKDIGLIRGITFFQGGVINTKYSLVSYKLY